MNRRTATVVGVTLALGGAGGTLFLAGHLYRERQAESARYELDLVRLRQEAARPAAGEPSGDETPAPRRRLGCVTGVDGFALAAWRASPSPQSLIRDGRLDAGRFRALSDQAVRAERWVEESREPPALPRRMGCARTERGTDGRERCVEPLDPPHPACGGQGFAEFPIAVPAAAAPSGAPATATAAAGPPAPSRPSASKPWSKAPPPRRNRRGWHR